MKTIIVSKWNNGPYAEYPVTKLYTNRDTLMKAVKLGLIKHRIEKKLGENDWPVGEVDIWSDSLGDFIWSLCYYGWGVTGSGQMLISRDMKPLSVVEC